VLSRIYEFLRKQIAAITSAESTRAHELTTNIREFRGMSNLPAISAIRDPGNFNKAVREVLTDLKLDKLRYLKEEDLVFLVDSPLDKANMKVAVRQYLLKYMTNDAAPSFSIPVEAFSFDPKIGYLTGAGLMSVNFGGMFVEDAPTAQDIPAHLDSLGIKPEDVKILNLSEQDLLDADVDVILNVVKSLPNCAVVTLAHNRITGSDEKVDLKKSIGELLALPQIEFVSITGNYVVGYSNRDFLVFPEEYANKLIWFNHQDFQSGEWKRMLPTSDCVDSTSKAHLLYFQKYQFPY
jgi:uncharacterized protein (DUF3820 family)